MPASGISSCISKGSAGGCAGGTGALAGHPASHSSALFDPDRDPASHRWNYKNCTTNRTIFQGAYRTFRRRSLRLCSWPALRLSHGCKAHRRPVSRRENQPPGIGIPADLLQQSKSCLSCYICGPDLSGGKSSGGISGGNSVSFRYDLHVLFPLLRLSKKKRACFCRPGIYRKQGSRTGRHPRFRDHEQF